MTTHDSQPVLGIDIGGSGIKAAVVDVSSGRLLTERLRAETPTIPRPASVVRAAARLVERLGWRGPIGLGFPGIVKDQICGSAANLEPSWVGKDLSALFGKATGCPVAAVNDADAAGLAEVKFGAARRQKGIVLVLTFGTGIGSALFVGGSLVPNLEFGHLRFKDGEAEHYASAAARKTLDLTWPAWGKRVNDVIKHMSFLVSPDLVVVGGGVSSKWERFARQLDPGVPIVPAKLQNQAGLVGAAVWAAGNLSPARLRVKRFAAVG